MNTHSDIAVHTSRVKPQPAKIQPVSLSEFRAEQVKINQRLESIVSILAWMKEKA